MEQLINKIHERVEDTDQTKKKLKNRLPREQSPEPELTVGTLILPYFCS